MCEDDLHTAVLLGAPVAGLHRQRPADGAVRLDQPGPARVNQERFAIMAERDLLAEVRAVYRRVPDHTGALPAADQEAHRVEAWVLLEMLRESAGPGWTGCMGSSVSRAVHSKHCGCAAAAASRTPPHADRYCAGGRRLTRNSPTTSPTPATATRARATTNAIPVSSGATPGSVGTATPDSRAPRRPYGARACIRAAHGRARVRS